MHFDSTTTSEQLETLPTNEILAAYNKVTGKATTKFNTRSKGIAQTIKALASIAPGRGKNPPTKPTGRKKSGMTFRMAPKTRQRATRNGTHRAKVLGMLKRDKGAKFTEVQEATGWNTKQAYEGIRLLNVYSGHGLWAETIRKDGKIVDYRIHVVDAVAFNRLVEASNR